MNRAIAIEYDLKGFYYTDESPSPFEGQFKYNYSTNDGQNYSIDIDEATKDFDEDAFINDMLAFAKDGWTGHITILTPDIELIQYELSCNRIRIYEMVMIKSNMVQEIIPGKYEDDQ